MYWLVNLIQSKLQNPLKKDELNNVINNTLKLYTKGSDVLLLQL